MNSWRSVVFLVTPVVFLPLVLSVGTLVSILSLRLPASGPVRWDVGEYPVITSSCLWCCPLGRWWVSCHYVFLPLVLSVGTLVSILSLRLPASGPVRWDVGEYPVITSSCLWACPLGRWWVSCHYVFLPLVLSVGTLVSILSLRLPASGPVRLDVGEYPVITSSCLWSCPLGRWWVSCHYVFLHLVLSVGTLVSILSLRLPASGPVRWDVGEYPVITSSCIWSCPLGRWWVSCHYVFLHLVLSVGTLVSILSLRLPASGPVRWDVGEYPVITSSCLWSCPLGRWWVSCHYVFLPLGLSVGTLVSILSLRLPASGPVRWDVGEYPVITSSCLWSCPLGRWWVSCHYVFLPLGLSVGTLVSILSLRLPVSGPVRWDVGEYPVITSSCLWSCPLGRWSVSCHYVFLPLVLSVGTLVSILSLRLPASGPVRWDVGEYPVITSSCLWSCPLGRWWVSCHYVFLPLVLSVGTLVSVLSLRLPASGPVRWDVGECPVITSSCLWSCPLGRWWVSCHYVFLPLVLSVGTLVSILSLCLPASGPVRWDVGEYPVITSSCLWSCPLGRWWVSCHYVFMPLVLPVGTLVSILSLRLPASGPARWDVGEYPVITSSCLWCCPLGRWWVSCHYVFLPLVLPVGTLVSILSLRLPASGPARWDVGEYPVITSSCLWSCPLGRWWVSCHYVFLPLVLSVGTLVSILSLRLPASGPVRWDVGEYPVITSSCLWACPLGRWWVSCHYVFLPLVLSVGTLVSILSLRLPASGPVRWDVGEYPVITSSCLWSCPLGRWWVSCHYVFLPLVLSVGTLVSILPLRLPASGPVRWDVGEYPVITSSCLWSCPLGRWWVSCHYVFLHLVLSVGTLVSILSLRLPASGPVRWDVGEYPVITSSCLWSCPLGRWWVSCHYVFLPLVLSVGTLVSILSLCLPAYGPLRWDVGEYPVITSSCLWSSPLGRWWVSCHYVFLPLVLSVGTLVSILSIRLPASAPVRWDVGEYPVITSSCLWSCPLGRWWVSCHYVFLPLVLSVGTLVSILSLRLPASGPLRWDVGEYPVIMSSCLWACPLGRWWVSCHYVFLPLVLSVGTLVSILSLCLPASGPVRWDVGEYPVITSSCLWSSPLGRWWVSCHYVFLPLGLSVGTLVSILSLRLPASGPLRWDVGEYPVIMSSCLWACPLGRWWVSCQYGHWLIKPQTNKYL